MKSLKYLMLQKKTLANIRFIVLIKFSKLGTSSHHCRALLIHCIDEWSAVNGSRKEGRQVNGKVCQSNSHESNEILAKTTLFQKNLNNPVFTLAVKLVASEGLYYETYQGRNLRIFNISQSVCPLQAFSAQSNACGQGWGLPE